MCVCVCVCVLVWVCMGGCVWVWMCVHHDVPNELSDQCFCVFVWVCGCFSVCLCFSGCACVCRSSSSPVSDLQLTKSRVQVDQSDISSSLTALLTGKHTILHRQNFVHRYTRTIVKLRDCHLYSAKFFLQNSTF